MSDDVRAEFARSYPEGHIEVPPVGDLWARGRRRRRHRTAMQVVGAAASVVVLAGVGAVYGLPESMTSPDAAPQIGSDGIEDEEPDRLSDGEGQPEGDCSGLDGYALRVCEDLEAREARPEPTEAERAEAAERQQAAEELHAEMNRGLRHAPEGWEPAEDPPADLSGLESQDGEGIWYGGVETETGLADRAMLEDRIGAETVAELCGWFERESARADEAAGEPVSRHTVAHHLLRAGEVTGGDGLSLVVAAACQD